MHDASSWHQRTHTQNCHYFMCRRWLAGECTQEAAEANFAEWRVEEKYQASTVVVLSVHVLLQATHLLLWRPHPPLLLA